MDEGLTQHIKKLDIKPNSVLFVNVEKIDPQISNLRLPFLGYTVPIVFTLGPPEVALLTRHEIEQALEALDNAQPAR